MKRYFRPLALIVCIGLIVSMGRTTISLLGKRGLVDQEAKKVEELEAEQARLLEIKERVGSDSFIEKEARDKLGLAREGESIVVLPPPEVLRRLAPPLEDEEYSQDLPIYERWKKMFF